MTVKTFNLLNEPWIIAETADGEVASVSIRDVFSGSVHCVHLRGESPVQDYAVLRLLLTIFWRAHSTEGPARGEDSAFADWFEGTLNTLTRDKADATVLKYLDQYENRFDLLNEETPFMQVADLHTKGGDTKPVSLIVPEASGDYFTMRAGDEQESIDLAEAARWLVYTQAFDYSGIKSGAVGDSRVKGGKGYPIGTGWTGMTGGTVIIRPTLLETLLFNTTKETLAADNDHPVWERIPDGPDERGTLKTHDGHPTPTFTPQGPADLATWQSRRVRLFVDEDDRVRQVLVANGDRIPDAGANVLTDPMTPYRFSSNKSKKDLDIYYPRPYDTTRTMWRSLEALLVAEGDPGFTGKDKPPLRPKTLDSLATLLTNETIEIDFVPLELISIEYGAQSSSVGTTVVADMPLPLRALPNDVTGKKLRSLIRRNAKKTMESAIALGSYGGNLLVSAGGEYSFQANAADQLLAKLEPLFKEWLVRLTLNSPSDELLVRADQSWENTVRRHVVSSAQTMQRGAGPKAYIGVMSDDGTQIHSAGRYYGLLMGKLNKILPTTAPSQEEKMKENNKKEENHDHNQTRS